MSGILERLFQVGWRDVDPNGHVANMVYLEYAVDTRIAFFASQDFPPTNFVKRGFGPVIKSDFVEYFNEVMMLDELRVTNENGGHSEDGSRSVVSGRFPVNPALLGLTASHRPLTTDHRPPTTDH